MKAGRVVVLLICTLLPSVIYAHTGHTEHSGNGFASGLLHPMLGFDHLLAMLSVGILSTQMGGRAIWAVPAAFVAMMVVGGVLALVGIPLFSIEAVIAFSVLTLGVSLAVERKLPWLIAMAVAGLFAAFHGYAHGQEMPSLATPALYAFGFALGTTAIHLLGVGIGTAAARIPQGGQVLRYVGAGIAGIGLHLLVG